MRTIHYSDQSQADIAAVTDYLDQHSPSASDRLAFEISDRLRLLASQPGIGRRRDDLAPGLRSSVIGKYILLYRSTDTTLEVVRFLHGARDIPAAFNEE